VEEIYATPGARMVTIPFEVMAKVVADAVRDHRVAALEDASYREILDLPG